MPPPIPVSMPSNAAGSGPEVEGERLVRAGDREERQAGRVEELHRIPKAVHGGIHRR